MARSYYHYSASFKLVGKDFTEKAGKALTKRIKTIVEDTYKTAVNLAVERMIASRYSRPHVYDSVRYWKSFRMSTGSAQSGSNPTAFPGAGYKSVSTMNFGDLKRARYFTIYNTASKKWNGELFRYSYLVDVAGWKSGKPPWAILDKTMQIITSKYPELRRYNR